MKKRSRPNGYLRRRPPTFESLPRLSSQSLHLMRRAASIRQSVQNGQFLRADPARGVEIIHRGTEGGPRVGSLGAIMMLSFCVWGAFRDFSGSHGGRNHGRSIACGLCDHLAAGGAQFQTSLYCAGCP
jgi:hypothetical protein